MSNSLPYKQIAQNFTERVSKLLDNKNYLHNHLLGEVEIEARRQHHLQLLTLKNGEFLTYFLEESSLSQTPKLAIPKYSDLSKLEDLEHVIEAIISNLIADTGFGAIKLSAKYLSKKGSFELKLVWWASHQFVAKLDPKAIN